MPACFQLIRKSDVAAGPVVLEQIDRELCEHFGKPCDDKYWFYDWYNYIGFKLAIGKTFQQILADIQEDDLKYPDEKPDNLIMREICLWLSQNFVPNAFYER